MSINVCIFSGNIGSEVQLKKTQDGMSVLNFSLAVRRNQNDTDWIQCSAFKEKAEFISKYFKKGSFILVRTRLKITTSEKDGKKTTYHNYEVQEVDFGGGKKEEHTELTVQDEGPEFDVGEVIEIDPDSLPF